MIKKLKDFFDYNLKLIQNAKLKYEVLRLKEDNKRKEKTIKEWVETTEEQEKRIEKFKKAYRNIMNEKEDIVQKCINLEKEIKNLRREVKRYEKAKIVFQS